MLDQIDRMVRQANPVPDVTVLEPFEASVPVLDQQRRTVMQTHDRVDVDLEPEKPRRNLAIGIAAAIVVAIGVVILARPMAPPVANQPLPPTSTEIGAAFVGAYGAFDVDRAASYLAADADLSGLEGGTENWRVGNKGLQAEGFKLTAFTCQEKSYLPSGTVRCPFDFHSLRSDEIGLGPFTGSYFDIRIRDGQVISASLLWDAELFSPQMWEPFAEWVAATYPDDAVIMYEDFPTQDVQRLSEESRALWELRSREYARVVAPGEAYKARAEAICMEAAAKLKEEWQAAELESGDGQGHMRIAAPILEEALRELRSLAPPEAVRAEFERDYLLLERENEWLRLQASGVDTEPQHSFPAAHFIQASLQGCTAGG